MVKVTLDVIRKLTSISPTSGNVGDIIMINGFAFGKKNLQKARSL